MGYEAWTINGIAPRWIRANGMNSTEGVDWTNFPKIIIHCAAYPDEQYPNPRDEIEMWKTLASETINNTIIDNGTDLQVSNGQIFTISNDTESWNGALYFPQFFETDYSNQLIEYDLIVELQLVNTPISAKYTPDYRLYSNIDYQCWTENNPEIVTTKTAGTVSQNPSPMTSQLGMDNYPWVNEGNIENGNGSCASCTNTTQYAGQTEWLQASNFGFDIPTDHIVTRVQIRVRYANNSVTMGAVAMRHFINIVGTNFPVFPITTLMQDFVQDSTPADLQDFYADTLGSNDNTVEIPSFSSDPATYNDSNFMVEYFSTLGNFKTSWVDFIQVNISYVPPGYTDGGDPNAVGYELGIMTITEEYEVNQVVLVGNACNLPATLTINGVTQSWLMSHNDNTVPPVDEGKQQLIFPVSPPSTIITLESSIHEAPAGGTDSAAVNTGSRPDYIENFFV